MIVEHIRYRIAERQRAEFEKAYLRASVPLGQAEQCVDYELARCTEDPGSYILCQIASTGVHHECPPQRTRPSASHSTPKLT
ncbi:antibiotic biosynthesis monooxygenase family protein [Streptomyces sp. NPDC093064]|uniref:antibiotic biosynthesis monooxygenase family protein n=1 Tax=Streptomyces sp. NPDC093064 TaxID=3366020 RepID=UPI0037FD4DD9